MSGGFVNTDNAKRPDDTYRKVIGEIREDGVCPFCTEHLTRYHQKPIIVNGQYWTLTDNMYPYKGAKHHILLIHKTHIESIADMSPQAWAELLGLIQAEVRKRAIAGGTFYVRFGDTSHTGASVTHLHANIISPETTNKDREPIVMRVG